jgi:hypothetical protein
VELHHRRGAPKGNRNRLKHGRYSAASLAQRKLVRETIRSAQLALLLAKLRIAALEQNPGSMAKSREAGPWNTEYR